MTDVVNKSTRSRMMSNIKNANTKPEKLIRTLLFRNGFRFRLHVRDLPGKPDIVLKKYRAVIFVNGCFWHKHGCELFKMPSSREDFWRKKLDDNKERDRLVKEKLIEAGWRVCVIWECAMKGKGKLLEEELVDKLLNWLKEGTECEIEGM